MTLSPLPSPNFTGADLSARVNAALTETRAARRLPTVAALLADASLAYGSGSRAVAAGDLVEAGGFRYAVADPAATDHHVTTAGGVKLHVRPVGRDFFVDAFGAVGDGTTDDAARINMAAVAARAAGRSYGLVFSQAIYRANAALDLTNIRRIQTTGEIRSAVTTGAAVTVGTTVNTNNDMDGGDILLFVRSTAANNAALAGTAGIRVRGAARCQFRLYSYGWDVGVDLAPDGFTGIQYLAFNTFSHVGTNGCRTGLRFQGSYNSGNDCGWINENTFTKADLYPQGNALAGQAIGVHLTGGYASNKNVFLDMSVEGQPVGVWIENGTDNQFRNVRFEVAGVVRWGAVAAASDKNVYCNHVHVGYPNGVAGVNVEDNGTRPNFVTVGDASPTWAPVLTMSFDDFYTVSGVVYSHKWRNTNTGTTRHPLAVLNATTRSFDVGSNHGAYVDLPVSKGDVLRIAFDFLASGGRTLTFFALDAVKANLPALSAGSIPYFGSDATPSSAGVPGTASFWDHANAAWRLPFHMSINRSEVKFIRVQMRSGTFMTGLLVERLLRGGQVLDLRPAFPPVKSITATTTPPDYPGQLAFLGGNVLIGTSDAAWSQLTVTAV